ncbi:MAG: tetratricopeptide repeat protein [Gemmatimonadota bacterium]
MRRSVLCVGMLVVIGVAAGAQSPAARLNRMGNDTARAGDWAAAVVFYTRAIGLEPDFAEPFYNRGKAKLNLEEFESAITDLSEAIRLNPANADAWNNRGIARKKAGDLVGAIQDYDTAIRGDSTLARVYLNRGLAHFTKGDRVAACEDFLRAANKGVAGADAALRSVNCQ